MIHPPIPLQKRNRLCTTNHPVQCRMNIPLSSWVGPGWWGRPWRSPGHVECPVAALGSLAPLGGGSRGTCDDEGEELVRASRHHGLCTVTKGPGGCCTGIYWVSCQSSAMIEQKQLLPFSFRPALPHLMCSQRPK